MDDVPSLDVVLADEAVARGVAWRQLRTDLGLDPDGTDADDDLAALVLDDPADHPWRVVDAALERSTCPACGAVLGAGERGCGPCDLADGSRFLAREPDRPGVPPGNEHAIRVSSTVVRHPHRWPAHAVVGNHHYLPLFVAGQMPTRGEQLAVIEAYRAGRVVDGAGATSFAELADRARAGR